MEQTRGLGVGRGGGHRAAGRGRRVAFAGGIIPERAWLLPVDRAYWQPFAGLPDSFGPLNEALVARVDHAGMPRVATIAGLEGQPTSVLGTLSFAVRTLPGGIEPCWDVAYTNPNGSTGNVMINPLTRSDFVTSTAPEPILGTDYTTWTWQVHLPAGSTIDTLTIGVDVSTNPPEPVPVAFDDITAASRTWTWFGSNLGL
ncbi:MAG: hypothetical protein ACYDHH_04060 [Solirubrobacteraceae bacterium]